MADNKINPRKKFGVSRKPIEATDVLVKGMDHDFGVPAQTLLIINRKAGTFTSANVYAGNLGKGYDAEPMTHPLPADDDAKWKKWAKDYSEADVADFDVLVQVEAPKAHKAAAPKAETVKA